MMIKQHNFRIQASTMKSMSDLQISKKGYDANSTDEILVNQTYVTQVNHEILNAKEKELQSWRSEKVFDEIEKNG